MVMTAYSIKFSPEGFMLGLMAKEYSVDNTLRLSFNEGYYRFDDHGYENHDDVRLCFDIDGREYCCEMRHLKGSMAHVQGIQELEGVSRVGWSSEDYPVRMADMSAEHEQAIVALFCAGNL